MRGGKGWRKVVEGGVGIEWVEIEYRDGQRGCEGGRRGGGE